MRSAGAVLKPTQPLFLVATPPDVGAIAWNTHGRCGVGNGAAGLDALAGLKSSRLRVQASVARCI